MVILNNSFAIHLALSLFRATSNIDLCSWNFIFPIGNFQFFISLAACARASTQLASHLSFPLLRFGFSHFSTIYPLSFLSCVYFRRLLRWVQTSIQCEALENVHRLLQLPTHSSHYWRENLLLSRWIESWFTCKSERASVDFDSRQQLVFRWYHRTCRKRDHLILFGIDFLFSLPLPFIRPLFTFFRRPMSPMRFNGNIQ